MTVLISAGTISVFAAGCGSSVTVHNGDTLRKIAERCGTTGSALRRVNPEIGIDDLIFLNQMLQLTGAILGTDRGFSIYNDARGDTLLDRREIQHHSGCHPQGQSIGHES